MKYFITYKGSSASCVGLLVEKSMFVTTDDIEKYWFDYKADKEPDTRMLTITALPEEVTK